MQAQTTALMGGMGLFLCTVPLLLNPLCQAGALMNLSVLLWGLLMLLLTFALLQVHDVLIGEKGMDPASDVYYNAIEQQVSEKFPEKWGQWQQVAAEAAAAGREAQAAAEAEAAHKATAALLKGSLAGMRPKMEYTTFRVPLKDPTPAVVADNRARGIAAGMAGRHRASSGKASFRLDECGAVRQQRLWVMLLLCHDDVACSGTKGYQYWLAADTACQSAVAN